MPIRPLQDHVLLRRLASEKETPGGIIIPDAAQTNSHEGEVIAVGHGRTLDSGFVRRPDVKPGDRVFFSARARGQEIEVEGEKRIVLPYDEILAVVERG